MAASDALAHEKARFELEIEFLQSLASDDQVRFLGASGYFRDEAFVRYLRYLVETYTQPAYARYLLYPQALRTARALVDDTELRDSLTPK